MASFLLDSNHANRLIDPRHPTRLRIRAAIVRGAVFYIILPVITETIFGFSILPRAQQNRLEWQAARSSLVLLHLDEADAVDAVGLQPHCFLMVHHVDVGREKREPIDHAVVEGVSRDAGQQIAAMPVGKGKEQAKHKERGEQRR